MKRTVTGWLKISLTLTLWCGAVWAQGGTAQIGGAVSDTTGAMLPGVEITATQTATGVVRTTLTNETGSYVLPNLAIGPYRLEAALTGFRTFVQTGIVLQVNSSVVINPQLEVGQVAQSVEVQANVAMIETRATGVGQVIDNAQILELPIVGRQVTDLVVLAGAAVQTGVLNASARSFPGVAQFSIAGGSDRGTSFTLDGASHNEVRGNFGLPLPFPDALQEFKVETSAVPAQYGFRSGGAVNAVTKSGTNQLHGGVFWFVRNEKFNARNFFATRRDTLKRNQFGGTVGGPIQRNKLFFFFGYQGTTTRETPTGSSTSFVPTPAMLAGDFTAFASTACRASAINLPTPFLGNRVDSSLLSPAAVKLAQLLPKAEDACGTTRWGIPTSQNEHQFVGKIDYQRNEKHSMFWRYMGYPYLSKPPIEIVNNVLTTGTAGFDNLFQALTFGNTRTLSSNMVNSLRLAWNRQATARVAPQFFGATDIGVNVYQTVPKKIDIAVTNAFGVGSRTSMPNVFRETGYQAGDDFGLIWGNHQINLGGTFMSFQTNNSSKTFTGGSFEFSGGSTGQALADFMLGRLTRLEQGAASRAPVRSKVLGLYVQDSWKARSNLTISAGLRFEPYIAQKFQYGSTYPMNHFDIDAFMRGERTTQFTNAPAGMFYPGDAQFPKGGNPSNQIENQWDKWAPRLGIVWDPTGKGRTVVRAAYGIFYETQNAELNISVGQGPPWAGKALLTDVSFDDPYRTFPGGNPFPFVADKNAPYPQAGVFATAFPGTSPPYVQQWNLGVQRELASDLLVSASYIGNQMTHLYGAVELNPGVYIPGVSDTTGNCLATVRGQRVSLNLGGPNRTCSTTGNLQARRVLSLLNANGSRGADKYSFIDAWDDGGTRSYHGMLLSVNKRMSNNFSTTANYTWSHCIGNPTNVLLNGRAGGDVLNDPNNRQRDRGNCNTNGQDIRHIANATTVFRMPRFSSAWVERLAGNWNISGILRARSGQWLSPTMSADRDMTGQNVTQQRPDLVSGNVYGNQCKTDLRTTNPTCRWLSTDAFAVPAIGAAGSAGPGTLLGPGSWTIDFGLSRTFRVLEGQQIEFRAEATNVLNHTNLSNPATNISAATFGRITSAADPRIMQFAIKYGF